MMNRTYESTNIVEKAIGKARQIAAAKVYKSAVEIPKDFRCISFCFDDFPQTAADKGAAILEDSGLRGTFFTCFGLLGQDSYGGRLASVGEVLATSQRGHEIGCHSYDHINCSFTDAENVAVSCHQNIKAAADHAITLHNFSYPQGGMSPGAKKIMRRYYNSARSGIQGINQGKCDLYCLKSMPLYEETIEKIRALINTVECDGGWLIIYTHDVSDMPSEHGISSKALSDIIATCVAKNLPVKPVNNVVQTLTKQSR
jgi:peptidoglycan/xylan/chitin deacetylase (PgdA/CDA1 family)